MTRPPERIRAIASAGAIRRNRYGPSGPED